MNKRTVPAGAITAGPDVDGISVCSEKKEKSEGASKRIAANEETQDHVVGLGHVVESIADHAASEDKSQQSCANGEV